MADLGLSDTLKSSALRVLQQQRVQLRLRCPPKLHGLIQASRRDPAPLSPDQVESFTADAWIPLLSLARLLGGAGRGPAGFR